MAKDSIAGAKALIQNKKDGVLSTLSVKLEGFPFGSVVPYSLDDRGRPVVFISTIAEHTKNITADNRCSLTIVAESDEVQAHGRICLVGNMRLLDEGETATKEKYYTRFPKSRSYDATHDFSFYRLEAQSIRYIGGFGRIHWLAPEDLMSKPYKGLA